jgi:hypothetical protein
MRNKGIIAMAIGLGAFATGLACGNLGEALQNEECYSDSDCGPLDCMVAIPAANVPTSDGMGGMGLPVTNVTGLGWCREQSYCAAGTQPFCQCAIDAASQIVCISDGDYNRVVPSTQPCWTDNPDPSLNNDPDCYCVPLEVQCAYPASG